MYFILFWDAGKRLNETVISVADSVQTVRLNRLLNVSNLSQMSLRILWPTAETPIRGSASQMATVSREQLRGYCFCQ